MAITRRDALTKARCRHGVSRCGRRGCDGTAVHSVAQAEEGPAAPPRRWACCTTRRAASGAKSASSLARKRTISRQTRGSTRSTTLPADLNSFTKNIIKLYKPADGKTYSYVKQQCMHCVDPACVAGCMFKGLQKDQETGVVALELESVRGLPLLRDFLSLSRSEIPVGRVQSQDREM